MTSSKITTAFVAAVLTFAAPAAMAQTTLGGNAKDNSASGGAENGTTEGAGKGPKGGPAMGRSTADGMTTPSKDVNGTSTLAGPTGKTADPTHK